jgi:lipoprotein LprG
VWKADPVLPSPRLSSALTAGVLLLFATACGGGEGGSDDTPPEDVLAAAKVTLDETSGVHLTLETDNLPDGVTGVEEAVGVATHAPAFEGTITVNLLGQAVEVPVVAVDDTVYAELPFTTGFQDVDPGDYGAPDPAQLMNPAAGLSTLLSETSDLEQGESVRGGDDNSEVLTEYSGTVSGDVMENVIPTATGEFDVVYTITDDDELRTARLTGVFYADSEPMSYTVTFEDYGTEKDITAP